MLKKILIVLALVIVGFVLFVQTRPGDFRYTRSATYAAPPAAVFAYVNDLHKWQDWSPWAKLDPNAKVTFEGPSEGVGSSFAWDGNSEVGAGKMTIEESKPNDLVKMKLEFLKPFQATQTAEFTLQPAGDQTTLTWAMYGHTNFFSKAMGCFIDCDKMIGGMFEKGLENLKAIVEPKPAT